MTHIAEVVAKIDWAMLAEQKLALLVAIGNPLTHSNALEGLLNLIDALQDAAEADGFPVVWLEGDE